MTEPNTGLPLEIILPSGKPAYLNPYQGTYSESRSYARRMQSSYARGLSQATARGHRTVNGRSESQIRRDRERITYGDQLPPWQRFGLGFEQRYGFSYAYWRFLRRNWIDEINQRAYPHPHSRYMMVDANGQRADPRIFPSDITAIRQLYDNGFRDPVHSEVTTWQQWVELRLVERLTAIRDYQDMHDPTFGRLAYQNRSSVWLNANLMGGASAPPLELWWYH